MLISGKAVRLLARSGSSLWTLRNRYDRSLAECRLGPERIPAHFSGPFVNRCFATGAVDILPNQS